jgi:catechol 2,3-dioxygenase-like lactoylglutathione lyase family enzyme
VNASYRGPASTLSPTAFPQAVGDPLLPVTHRRYPRVKEGGQIRHIFFDTGRDQFIAFMEARGVPGIPAEYDAGINRGLGIPSAFYHFAFEAGSVAALEAKRTELLAKGVKVTEVVHHDEAKSIYFKDPNGLQLEYCYFTRDIGTEDDVRMQERFEVSVQALGLEDTTHLPPSHRSEESPG